jgi:transcription elongation factor Elf1
MAKSKKVPKVEQNDYTCPECNSEDIVGDEVMIESGEASQKCHCSNCDASWWNVYKFAFIQKMADFPTCND